MKHREEIVEYIFNQYKKRVGQLEIANKLDLTRKQVSLVTLKLDYLYGLDKTEGATNATTTAKDFSFSSDERFSFLDSVKLPE